MREIKFRAWTGREIMHVDTMQYEPSEGSMIGNNCWLPKAIMQYTGLKDKNGKEIFGDSDIIKTDHNFGHIEYFYVGWHRDGFKLFYLNDYFEKDNPVNLLYEYASFSEIIGNIYENPELLNEQK